jgi:hypothetical protein
MSVNKAQQCTHFVASNFMSTSRSLSQINVTFFTAGVLSLVAGTGTLAGTGAAAGLINIVFVTSSSLFAVRHEVTGDRYVGLDR